MSSGTLILIHGGALGDFVLTLHLLQGILDQLDCDALIIARGQHRALVPQNDHFEFKNLEADPMHQLFGNPADTVLDQLLLDKPTPYTIIDCIGTSLTANLARKDRMYRIDPRPRPKDERHILAQWSDQLKRQGLHVTARAPDWFAPDCHQSGSMRHVVIHPGSGANAKCWPLANFQLLAKALASSAWVVSWALGPVEMDTWSEHQIAELATHGTIRAFDRLDQYVNLVQSAHMFIGNDSGPAHLAATMRCPSVVIFCATNPNIWAPPTASWIGGSGSDQVPSVANVLHAVDQVRASIGSNNDQGM